jgi:hypothetical protein
MTIPMSEPRILIAASSYVSDQGRVELTKLWLRAARILNPGIDIVLVDSNSPFNPNEFLAGVEVFRFEDNIGAISQGYRDGSGRAFCRTLDLACEGGYDYVVSWETDLLFALPLTPIVEKMHRTGVKVAAPWANPFQFVEWGCSFWSTQYLRESRFTERYDWKNTPTWPIPEFRIQAMVEEELFILPIHGWRNSENRMNIANIAQLMPYFPPRFITHCRDFSLYYRFLDLNGVTLT